MRSIAIGQVGPFIESIPRHAVRLLAGLDAAALAEALAAGPRPARPVLRLDLDRCASTGAVIRAARDGLGRAVSSLWPFLWAGEDFTDAQDDALTRAHLDVRFERLARRVPGLSQSWAAETARRLIAGRHPLRPGTPPILDWEQLVLALSPAGLVIATPLPAGEPAAVLAACGWLAECAPVSVLLFARDMPDLQGPHGRVSYGAGTISGPRPPAADPPPEPLILAEPDVEGRPHPLSAAEMRLYCLIQADAELAPLFAFNRRVPEVSQMACRVDVLWAAGRVVVEVDGPEHRGATRYRADRLRDHALMCAGYRVLRLTNEDVIEDGGLALARIRDIVRLNGRHTP